VPENPPLPDGNHRHALEGLPGLGVDDLRAPRPGSLGGHRETPPMMAASPMLTSQRRDGLTGVLVFMTGPPEVRDPSPARRARAARGRGRRRQPARADSSPRPSARSPARGHEHAGKGWFETCPALGAVFLDEIGEVDPAIQVKLLRVLQTRTFQRLGDTADRRFSGKLIAATNRDLRQALAAGRFREDFYYRLCADLLVTPTLAERLQDTPGELRTLLHAIGRRVAGDGEADDIAAEAEAWIDEHLGRDYAWPGNVRELEQCVRNLVIRGT